MTETSEYNYLISSQTNLLKNEVIEEILRERAGYYQTKKKEIDFWLVIAPKFISSLKISERIKSSNFYKNQYQNIVYSNNKKSFEFYASLISSDKEFIKWIKLRIGYFEDINNIGKLNSSLISNGISGSFSKNSESKHLLEGSPTFLHPDLLINNYKTSLNLYYQEYSHLSL